ncbi:MAG: FecR domain-containing protein [Parabacteroides sp.]|nr:FecR domain-containing protein [Parabacteroides sp.]
MDRNTLVRYFEGASSEKEKEAIRQWLEEDSSHKKMFINERIRFDASLVIEEERIRVPHTPGKSIIRSLIKVAAAILILIGSSYLFNLYQAQKYPLITQEVYVPPGNRTSITLPDGTLVWLNSNTKLQYPTLFTGNQRIVNLDGEAYFEVTKDKKKRFIVQTNTYNVEVLGTSFNVEAYTDKETFSTALFTGKVKLYKPGQTDETLLAQGETAELIDNELRISSLKSETYRWYDGLIVIEDKSFEEIMQLFEKYFGQKIIIQNKKVKELGYHGKLRISDGVDHALRVLQNDFRFTYKRDEDSNRIYIY